MSEAPDQPGPTGHSSARLARSSALMASGTLVSRVMGLVRTALLVGIVGTGLSGDAWDTANTLPNTIYILLAGGILNVVFVPQITRALAQEDKGRAFTDRLITLALAALLATTVVVTAGAYAVTKLYAWSWTGEQLGLAVAFAYLCLPQVFFYGLYSVLGQVLNAQEKFGWYMWAPVANNIVAISGLAVFAVLYPGTDVLDPGEWTSPMILLLGGTATLGVVVQAAVLLPVVWRSGFRWRPRWGFRGVGLGSASRMALWTLAIIGVSQTGLLLSTNVLNWNAEANPGVPGKIVYSTAFLIFILPHSLVATSLLTAMFPQLSRAAMTDDRAALGEQYKHGLRLLGAAMVPVSVAVLLLAPQLSASLLVFTGQGATDDIAWVVRALTLGLVPYGMYLLSQRVFHAYQEGKPPFRLQTIITGIAVASLVVAVMLPPQVTAMAIGAGQSLGQAVAAVLGIWWVRRRLDGVPMADVRATYLRALAASLVPVLPVLGVIAVGERVFDGKLASLSVLVSGGVVFFVMYGVLAHLFGVRELAEVVDPLLRRVRRRRPGGGPPDGGPEGGGPQGGRGGGPDGDRPDGAAPDGDRADGSEALVTQADGERADGEPQRSGTATYRSAGRSGPTARLLLDGPTSTDLREEPMVHGIDTGTVLGGRYELEELLARRDDTLDYWSANDQTLDRLVAVTVLPATGDYEEMAHAVLDGARRTAGVDDPRLVRVLDVGLEQEVCWIVEEGLSEAESLASLVLEHPLPAEEARRIVGEAASGLESARRRGLHHLYLNPHAVLRTSEGSVKVSGVGVAAAIEQADDVSAAEASLIDTTDLLSLLYTGLTGRWPGEDIEGLRPARRLADGTLPAPSEVVAGVPGDLDTLCRMTFGAEYAPDRGPQTPGELARQLAPWPSELVPGAGGQEFGPDAPLEDSGAEAALAAGAGAGAAVTAAHAHDSRDEDEAAHEPGAGHPDAGDEDVQPRQQEEPHYYRTREEGPSDDVFAAGAGSTAAGDRALAGAEVDRPTERRQSGAVLALVAAILVVAVFLAYGVFQGFQPDADDTAAPGAGATSTATQTEDEDEEGEQAAGDEGDGDGDGEEETAAPEDEDDDAPLEPISLAGITSYDPEGDGDERNDIVDRAIDGDSTTSWNSHTYLASNWGNLKSGVGLLVDLGGSQEVREVDIDFPEGDYGVEVFVTDEASRDGATSIGTSDEASGEVTFTAEEPVEGEYVLIWFDRAWAGPGGEIVYVSEIVVK
ncbi:murein biosynthesis integral membrane protein MurJ [Ornithinimicrobium sediminis]|uniref:murein biosynthesis integral membrane protein MurJ n=1 Tax=Ornithinimicrobium sediminis TaxID=2904603 RepID=UPI001E5B206E|nr:murein biosynthesis integral membrane protein MurJ [Ornithinimicrobium sediminis]